MPEEAEDPATSHCPGCRCPQLIHTVIVQAKLPLPIHTVIVQAKLPLPIHTAPWRHTAPHLQ